MATSKEEIKEWVEEGKNNGSTHVMIVCDTYDYDDYPVYVQPEQDIREMLKAYSKDMQKVMEVYSMNLDIDEQLSEHRSFNLD